MGPFESTSVKIHFNMDCIRGALEKLLSTDRFVLKSCEVRPAGEGLLGFLGEHSKLLLTYALDGTLAEVTVFVKSIPQGNESRADYNDKYGMFNREVTVYEKILSQFSEDSDCKKWHPKCLQVTSNYLIFEDLNMKGFQMRPLEKSLDYDHCLIALITLSRFHSASYILEEIVSLKNNTKYRLQDYFKDELGTAAFAYNSWFKTGINSSLCLAAESQKYGKLTPHFEKVKKEWSDAFKNGVKMISLSTDTRNIITHSDLWNNNMMYRYDDDGKPAQCVLVDFQACRFTPPAADVMSFLYMNLSAETRNEYTDKLIIFYYNQMKNNMSEKNIKIEDVLPWTEFRNSCESFRKWGLVQSLIIFQFIFMDGDEALKSINNSEAFEKLVNQERTCILMELLKNNPAFRERIMPNVDEFIGRFIIKDIPQNSF